MRAANRPEEEARHQNLHTVVPWRAPVRLVLVDDHEMVIEGLKAMLAAFTDRVQVVGQAVGAERALERRRRTCDPDVVLCDVRMQGSSGLDLCKSAARARPGPQGRDAVGLRRRAVPVSGAARRRVADTC